jgi:hypothetical protein
MAVRMAAMKAGQLAVLKVASKEKPLAGRMEPSWAARLVACWADSMAVDLAVQKAAMWVVSKAVQSVDELVEHWVAR